jgi:hypothetical protein
MGTVSNRNAMNQGERDCLEGGRCARRGGARNFQRNENDQGSDFEPMRNGNDGKAGSLRGDDGAYGGADRTDMRSGRRGRQIGTKVELRRQKDNGEE